VYLVTLEENMRGIQYTGQVMITLDDGNEVVMLYQKGHGTRSLCGLTGDVVGDMKCQPYSIIIKSPFRS